MLIFLAAVIAAVAAVPVDKVQNRVIMGQHTFTSGYVLNWTVNSNSITFTATNSRNAYAAFGLNIYGPYMDSADSYAISMVGGVPTVGDYLNLGYAPPTPDTSIGCSNDVENWSGSIGPTTTFTFTRAINTQDTCDYPIRNGPNQVVWAFGFSGMRGATNIDFMAGQVTSDI